MIMIWRFRKLLKVSSYGSKYRWRVAFVVLGVLFSAQNASLALPPYRLTDRDLAKSNIIAIGRLMPTPEDANVPAKLKTSVKTGFTVYFDRIVSGTAPTGAKRIRLREGMFLAKGSSDEGLWKFYDSQEEETLIDQKEQYLWCLKMAPGSEQITDERLFLDSVNSIQPPSLAEYFLALRTGLDDIRRFIISGSPESRFRSAKVLISSRDGLTAR